MDHDIDWPEDDDDTEDILREIRLNDPYREGFIASRVPII